MLDPPHMLSKLAGDRHPATVAWQRADRDHAE